MLASESRPFTHVATTTDKIATAYAKPPLTVSVSEPTGSSLLKTPSPTDPKHFPIKFGVRNRTAMIKLSLETGRRSPSTRPFSQTLPGFFLAIVLVDIRDGYLNPSASGGRGYMVTQLKGLIFVGD